jgi:hypothetical protein
MLVALALVLSSATTVQAGAPAGDVPSLEVRVNAAISRGLKWLKAQQKPDGTFPGQEGRHPGGETALAGLALVKSGVARGDPVLYALTKVLAGNTWKSTYSAAVYLMFLEAQGKPEKTSVPPEAARACLDFLVANQRDGTWAYPDGDIDMSNTQFALLGLRAARKLGLEVPEKVLEKSATALWRWQDSNGGFPYTTNSPTGGMTAATLGGFAVLGELGKGNARVEEVLGKKKKDLQRAEAWLEARFETDKNPYGRQEWTPTFQYAYLWAIERWCGFTGRTKIGTRDWYREGAEWLIDDQNADGQWGRWIDDQCFALLFLRRATVTGWTDLTDLYKSADAAARAKKAAPALNLDAAVPRQVDWLLAGPYQDKRGCPMLFEPPFDPSRIELREKVKLGNRAFERVTLKADGWTNLEELTGHGGDQLLWVMATRLEFTPQLAPALDARGSDAAKTLPIVVWFALEDGWRVFFDGKEVSSGLRVQAPIEDTVSVPLELAPGSHALVVLVGDELGASAFSMRASDAHGKPLGAGFSCGVDATGSAVKGTKGGKK